MLQIMHLDSLAGNSADERDADVLGRAYPGRRTAQLRRGCQLMLRCWAGFGSLWFSFGERGPELDDRGIALQDL